jgi:hypothetical protein
MKLAEQYRTVTKQVRTYAIVGMAIHTAGFALGFVGQGFYQLEIVALDSGFAVLEPFGDLLFGLGLVIVVAAAARAWVDMKYLFIAGAIIGLGLFYKSALHEVHIASGIGFDLLHSAHVGMGAILITVSVAVLAIMAFVYSKSNRQVEGK